MDFVTFLATVGLLGFAAVVILFSVLLLTNAKHRLFILKYPFAMCWPYLLALILSNGEIAYIEDGNDGFFYFILTMVSIVSAVWVFYLICKWFFTKVSDYVQAYPIKRRFVIKGILCAVLLVIALPPSINYIRTQIKVAEEKRLFSDYCVFNDYSFIKTESIKDCLYYLFILSDEQSDLIDKVDDNYPSWQESAKETNALLCSEIDRQYKEQFGTLLNNCTVNFPFSNEELLSAFSSYGNQIKRIIEHNEKGDYSYAFSSYLDIHNRYKEDCVYYLISSIAPEVFKRGLREELLSIGVYDGQAKLNEIVAYIDSRPIGRSGYETDIAIAQQQLDREIAEHHAYELNRMKNTTEGYPFYVGMRESQLDGTALGKPDSVELCRDFYKLQTRARSKTYEWESDNEHGWYKVTVSYRMHNSNRFDDYVDLPSDNGYVSSITWSNGKEVQSVLYADKNK